MNKINPSSKVPLYHQLYEILRSKIIKENWGPGDLMPPELELAKKYNVSRITVRQVMDLLVKEGLVFRERGRGTYIAQPKLEQGLERIVSFTEDMIRRGKKPGTRVLRTGTVKASKETADLLDMEEGEDFISISRLRTADNEPMSVEHSFLNPAMCDGILKYNLAKKSLRELMDQKYNIRWKRAKQTIQAINATAEIATLLGIKKNDPILYIERVSYTQDDVPGEFLQVYYRADRDALHNDLKG